MRFYRFPPETLKKELISICTKFSNMSRIFHERAWTHFNGFSLRERETDRQTDRQRERDRQTERERERKIDRQR